MYADDLAIWTRIGEQHRVLGMKNFQKSINQIKSYMAKNGFQLAAEKTVLMAFNRGRPNRDLYSIQLNGHTIRPSTQVKFLGVIINQNLTWGSHINSANTKARKALNIIKLLSRQSWATPKSQLIITKALVRSRLLYDHQVLFTAPKCLWEKLQTTDVMAIKAALNLPNWAVTTLAYQEAGWLPLQKECQRLNARFEVQR